MYRIFIVEDDPALAGELRGLLQRWEYEVVLCEQWKDVLGDSLRAAPHLVIMDVNLPFLDGYAWCARIRQVSSVPVLFLSARDTPADAIRAMEGGGDDYLTKPFEPQMLISKVSAMLRRAYEYVSPGQGYFSHAGVTLDVGGAALAVGDIRIELSRNELKLMARLMERKGKMVARDELMRLLWDDDVYVNENSLTVSVNRLRKRLAEAGLPEFITTKKGIGYGIMDS